MSVPGGSQTICGSNCTSKVPETPAYWRLRISNLFEALIQFVGHDLAESATPAGGAIEGSDAACAASRPRDGFSARETMAAAAVALHFAQAGHL